MTKIGIQGKEDSYHEQALIKLQGNNNGVVYFDTHDNVFNALKNGEIDSALVAIKNNRYGFVPESLNRILSGDFAITDEVYVRIDHKLLGLKGSTLDQIVEIHSHPAALGQCTHLLQKLAQRGVKAIEQNDTAESAQFVAQWNDPSKAAIASGQAGIRHGLAILQVHAQDDSNNITRFVQVERRNGQQIASNANKSTALLKTNNQAGSLVAALQPFADFSVNIFDLHSYPLPNSAFRMEFFIEFEGNSQHSTVLHINQELQKSGNQLVILGSYRSQEIPIDKA